MRESRYLLMKIGKEEREFIYNQAIEINNLLIIYLRFNKSADIHSVLLVLFFRGFLKLNLDRRQP